MVGEQEGELLVNQRLKYMKNIVVENDIFVKRFDVTNLGIQDILQARDDDSGVGLVFRVSLVFRVYLTFL